MTDQNSTGNPNTTNTASGRTGENTERFKEGTSDAVNRTRATADHAADHVEHGMHRGADKIASAAQRAKESGRKAMDTAMEHADDWTGKACDYVREKPTQSLVMAVAAGWLLSKVLRHRH